MIILSETEIFILSTYINGKANEGSNRHVRVQKDIGFIEDIRIGIVDCFLNSENKIGDCFLKTQLQK